MIQENYQDLRNEMKSYFVGTTWGLHRDFFLYDGKESDAKQIFLKNKQRFFNSQFFGIKGFSKNKISTSRRVLLEDLITVFKQKNAVSQVSVDGFCKTSFSYIDKMRNDKETGKTRKELLGSVTMDRLDTAKPSEFGMLVRSNIIQIREVTSCAEKSTQNKYSYTTFEFRINPEYIPFVDALNNEIWADLSCWQNNEVEMVDLANSPHQAKQAEKQAQTNEIREKLLQIVKSDKQILFESLLKLESPEEQDAYFVGLITSLGNKVTYSDRRNTSKLLQEFHAFKNKRNNIYEKIWNVNRQQPKPKPAQASEQRTALGFSVATASQTATATAQQSAPVFTNTKETDKELAKEEFNPHLRNHDISKETSDPRLQNVYKQVLASKKPIYEDRPIPKEVKTPMPMPSRNNERPASIDLKAELEKDRMVRQQQQTNRHDHKLTEQQIQTLKTLILIINDTTKLKQAYPDKQPYELIEIYDIVDFYEKQKDYNFTEVPQWIWNLKT